MSEQSAGSPKQDTVQVVSRRDRTAVSRITNVFLPEYTDSLHNAVLRNHTIVSTAFLLVKLWLIRSFDDLKIVDILDLTTMPTFDISLEKFSKSMVIFSNELELTDGFFLNALTVVSSNHTKKKGRPFSKENTTVYNMYHFYDDMAKQGALPEEKSSGVNLSHVFKYEKVQMKTAYRNNIRLHYQNYIKRLIRITMTNVFLKQKAVEGWKQLDLHTRNEFSKERNLVVRYLMEPGCKKRKDASFPEQWKPLYDVFKKVFPLDNNYLYNLKMHPERFLPYMIYINRRLEKLGIKLYNPLPIRRDFIPKSMTIDSNALVDLLVNADVFPLLATHLRTICGWNLSETFGKQDFYKGSKHIDNWIRNISPEKRNAQFKSDIWSFFVKNKVRRSGPGYKFNNMITTNGYQCSTHYVDEDTYYRERYLKGVKVCQEKEWEEFMYVHKLTEAKRKEILQEQASNECVISYNDPGKAGICTFTNGEVDQSKRKVFIYTRNQRRIETSFFRNEAERKRIMKTRCEKTGKSHKELQETIKSSAKSCNMDTFQNYIKERRTVEESLTQLYAKPCFRRRKYRSLLGKRSSEDKLVHKIKTTFDAVSKRGTEHGHKLIIMWGNWGRNPNLRHQPPSPGIGLRRRIHRDFETYTCDERGTSSRCPKCRGEMEYPVQRMKKVYDETKDEKVHVLESVHQVLRCKNESCRTWWNRDILGSCNIRKQSDYGLRNGHVDPEFLGIPKPKKRTSTSKGGKRVALVKKPERTPEVSHSG